MRFLPLLNALALLPVMVVAHGWYFSRTQMQPLQEELVQVLKSLDVEIQDMRLDLLDLRLQASAPTPEAHAQAMTALSARAPLRLREVVITLPASLTAVQESSRLQLSGTLPADADVPALLALVQSWRPDLQVEASSLSKHAAARWPEGENTDWHPEGSLLKPLRAQLSLPARLEVTLTHEGALMAQGIVPESKLREELITALTAARGATPDAAALHVSPLAGEMPVFTTQDFTALVRAFFSVAGPKQLTWSPEKGLRLEADALPSQVETWLPWVSQLQNLKIPVDHAVRLHASPWHLPGRAVKSQLSEHAWRELSLVLEAEPPAEFEGSSAQLTEESQARLSSLVPELLAAGAELRLIIGSHPTSTSQQASESALARARSVADALYSAGLPAPAATVTVFESTASAPSSSVEILIH